MARLLNTLALPSLEHLSYEVDDESSPLVLPRPLQNQLLSFYFSRPRFDDRATIPALPNVLGWKGILDLSFDLLVTKDVEFVAELLQHPNFRGADLGLTSLRLSYAERNGAYVENALLKMNLESTKKLILPETTRTETRTALRAECRRRGVRFLEWQGNDRERIDAGDQKNAVQWFELIQGW